MLNQVSSSKVSFFVISNFHWPKIFKTTQTIIKASIVIFYAPHLWPRKPTRTLKTSCLKYYTWIFNMSHIRVFALYNAYRFESIFITLSSCGFWKSKHFFGRWIEALSYPFQTGMQNNPKVKLEIMFDDILLEFCINVIEMPAINYSYKCCSIPLTINISLHQNHSTLISLHLKNKMLPNINPKLAQKYCSNGKLCGISHDSSFLIRKSITLIVLITRMQGKK